MDITTLVIGYLLTSAFCTTMLVSACMVSGGSKDTRKTKMCVVRVARSRGIWHYVGSAAHAR